MNRALSVAMIAFASLAMTSCAADVTSNAQHPAADSSSKSLDAAMRCNLGERYDATANAVRAHYELPVDADYVNENYGDWVANQSCSDAQIIAWQQLRREAGQSPEICRVVYESDLEIGIVYPIGCAVPVMVVTDASR